MTFREDAILKHCGIVMLYTLGDTHNFVPSNLSCLVGDLSCLVCFMKEGDCSTRVNQPVVWLRAGRLSPLCRWIQSGCRQSFGGWSRDTAQHFQCSPDTPRSCLAVRLRSAWRYLCPCCAVSRAGSVLWDRTVGFPCRSSAVT